MNHTHYECCSCHSNPPCSFCVDTFECDVCGDRHYADDENQFENKEGFVCVDCYLKSVKKLHLVLTAEWFDMIEQLIKKHEYRSFTDFWCRRLFDYSKATEDDLPFKEFDVVEFQHGYSKKARRMIVEFKGIGLGLGKPEWGGSKSVVFIIKLGNILHRNF